MKAGKPGDKSICKWCGEPIFWLEPDSTPRWTHGIDRANWKMTTPCRSGYEKDAEPSEAYNVQQILLKYED